MPRPTPGSTASAEVPGSFRPSESRWTRDSYSGHSGAVTQAFRHARSQIDLVFTDQTGEATQRQRGVDDRQA